MFPSMQCQADASNACCSVIDMRNALQRSTKCRRRPCSLRCSGTSSRTNERDCPVALLGSAVTLTDAANTTTSPMCNRWRIVCYANRLVPEYVGKRCDNKHRKNNKTELRQTIDCSGGIRRLMVVNIATLKSTRWFVKNRLSWAKIVT